MSLIKRFILYTCLVFSVVTPSLAHAVDLDSAFGGLMNNTSVAVNKGGYFEAGARGIYSAGGFDVRFSTSKGSNIQLISITPPKFNYGCGGISAFFGGFSFVSSEQITELIRNIAQGAVAFVVHMVIKTLCPQCEAVLQLMQKLAQMASKVQLDGCRLGYKLMEELAASGKVEEGTQASMNVCGAKMAAEGSTKDFLTAINDTCGKLDKLSKQYSQWLYGGNTARPLTSPADKAAWHSLGTQYGNITWKAIDIMMGTQNVAPNDPIITQSYSERILFMNLLGVMRRVNRGEAGIVADYRPPTLLGQRFPVLLMCGSTPIAAGDRRDPLNDFCRVDLGPSNTAVYTGVNNENVEIYGCDEPFACENIGPVKLKDVLVGKGFVFAVRDVLSEAIKEVAKGNSIPAEARALADSSSYPLYQLINIGAVYPGVAQEMVSSLSWLIGMQLATSYLQKLVEIAPHITSTAEAQQYGQIPDTILKALTDALSQFYSKSTAMKDSVSKNMVIQQHLTESIRQVNKAIQQQVMMQELAPQQAYSQGLLKRYSQNAASTNNK